MLAGGGKVIGMGGNKSILPTGTKGLSLVPVGDIEY
jgi:hypothetical protein